MSLFLSSSTILLTRPRPAIRPGRFEAGLYSFLLSLWVASVLLYLAPLIRPDLAILPDSLRTATVDFGSTGLVLLYLLVVARALQAHVADIRTATRDGSVLPLAWSTVRGTSHLCILTLPFAMGLILAFFPRLSYATTLADREGQPMEYVRSPDSALRLPLANTDIPYSACLAADAVEDRGMCTSPLAHMPVSPQSLLRNVSSVSESGAQAELSGGSGLSAQICKNYFQRFGLDALGTFLPARAFQGVTLLYKFGIEFECAWIYERIAVHLGPEHSPVTLWLNLAPFGRNTSGLQAGSLALFGKDAKELTPEESLLLVSRAQAPGAYDPVVDPELAAARTAVAAELMATSGYWSEDQAAESQSRPPAVLPRPPYPLESRHLFFGIAVQQLQELGFSGLADRGLFVRTSLDSSLQALAERTVRAHLALLAPYHASDAATVAIVPSTGEIVALVGSATDGTGPAATEHNLAVEPRQPGSAIKPLTYLAAFEEGMTPATLLWDLPVEFDEPGSPAPFRPANFDGRFHGPVRIREALANSYNIPAVEVLQKIGIPKLLDTAQRFGITTLTRPQDYGLSLTLGSGEVRLTELTGAFAVLANGGNRVAPTAILEVADPDGHVLWRYQPRGEQVARPEHAYLITSILSDNGARTPAFGADSPLQLDRPAAVKTGTTNDYRDSLTVGYTPDFVTGVWVGNEDGTPMESIAGVDGAAPI